MSLPSLLRSLSSSLSSLSSSSSYKSPSTLPGMHPNKVVCCVMKRCTAPCSVHCRLSRHAASLLSRHTLHITPSLSCCTLPLSSLVASLLSRCLSPLSLPLSSPLITPHSPLCQEQGWLLLNKKLHRRLTTSLGAPTTKNGALPLTTSLGAPPPLSSCCLYLVMPYPSCHAIPLFSRHASLVSSLSRFICMIDGTILSYVDLYHRLYQVQLSVTPIASTTSTYRRG